MTLLQTKNVTQGAKYSHNDLIYDGTSDGYDAIIHIERKTKHKNEKIGEKKNEGK